MRRGEGAAERSRNKSDLHRSPDGLQPKDEPFDHVSEVGIKRSRMFGSSSTGHRHIRGHQNQANMHPIRVIYDYVRQMIKAICKTN